MSALGYTLIEQSERDPRLESHETLEQYRSIVQSFRSYPQLRFMGSKQRLLPWIYAILEKLSFDTALDAFSGSGCVAYLLKAMGKQVTANDFLNFSSTIARALIENRERAVAGSEVDLLLESGSNHPRFIEETFSGIFYKSEDLRFLDRVSWNIRWHLSDKYAQAVAMAALIRACIKRQPRGVFTVAGDPPQYNDGRRDLRLSLEEQFLEQIEVYNKSVFCNGRQNRALHRDIFDVEPVGYDLVYLDPPYVPRHDDNCYIKRYHFLEGLSRYWEGVNILQNTKVKKIEKPFTPFSYRRHAISAFDRLFRHFALSKLVLSYSSNGYPDLNVLVDLLGRYKKSIHVYQKPHRYHFGTHRRAQRTRVQEYLIVGE